MDLKLLTILIDLYRTRSVSQTAENLRLTQPSVSMSLARLREYFQDPLFVRTTDGMAPTPRMEQMIESLSSANDQLRFAIENRTAFNPEASTRIFLIAGTDLEQALSLPSIVKRLHQKAPSTLIEFSEVSRDTPRHLESGQVELALAVGFVPALKAGFHRQRLLSDRHVCIVRAGHPRIRGELGLETFKSELHVVVATSGAGRSLVEKALQSHGIVRRVGVRTPNFVGVPTIVGQTDFLALVPERLAKVFASSQRLKVFPQPFPIPPFPICQYWHDRTDQDPGSRWLRSTIAQLFMAERSC
jgi:DNA-binding transcriptional LysR family regulator